MEDFSDQRSTISYPLSSFDKNTDPELLGYKSLNRITSVRPCSSADQSQQPSLLGVLAEALAHDQH